MFYILQQTSTFLIYIDFRGHITEVLKFETMSNIGLDLTQVSQELPPKRRCMATLTRSKPVPIINRTQVPGFKTTVGYPETLPAKKIRLPVVTSALSKTVNSHINSVENVSMHLSLFCFYKQYTLLLNISRNSTLKNTCLKFASHGLYTVHTIAEFAVDIIYSIEILFNILRNIIH